MDVNIIREYRSFYLQFVNLVPEQNSLNLGLMTMQGIK